MISLVLLLRAGRVMCGILLLVSAASAAQMTFSIANVNAGPGTTVSMPVMVTDASNVGSVEITLVYDPAVLKMVSVDKGSLGKGIFATKTDLPGTIVISVFDSAGMTGSGSVADIKFNAVGTTGSTSPVVFKKVGVRDAKDSSDIPTVSSGGLVTVKTGGIGAPGFDAFVSVAGILCVIGLGIRHQRSKKVNEI